MAGRAADVGLVVMSAEWPIEPELVPVYFRGLLPALLERPPSPPFEVRWHWRWTTCDGMYLASSDVEPRCIGAVTADFTCPVHAAPAP